MRQRLLGRDALAVSIVGYGGMHLSINGRPPEADGLRVLEAAFDAGVSLVDTADVYCLDQHDIGHNERLIARALASWSGRRDAITVATKGGVVRPGGRWERDARPVQLRAACDRSLKALGIEQIALYQLHAPDPKVPFAESVGELGRLRDEGRVRWVGLSNVSAAQVRQAQAIVPITTVQNRLNPFFRESLADGVVRYCSEQEIGFLAYSPTGGGRLNLKLAGHPVLAGIAKERGVSAHAVVLAWVLAQGSTVIVIPSARRVEHALDSVSAAGLTLSPEELAAIDAAEFSRA